MGEGGGKRTTAQGSTQLEPGKGEAAARSRPPRQLHVAKDRRQASKKTTPPPKSVKHDIGTRFKKLFGNRVTYLGQVVKIGPTVKGGTKRGIVYSDGDTEDLFTWEIDAHIKKHGHVKAAPNAIVGDLTIKQLRALSVSVPIDSMSRSEIARIVAGADMSRVEKDVS